MKTILIGLTAGGLLLATTAVMAAGITTGPSAGVSAAPAVPTPPELSNQGLPPSTLQGTTGMAPGAAPQQTPTMPETTGTSPGAAGSSSTAAPTGGTGSSSGG
jgi:hypothetical protein